MRASFEMNIHPDLPTINGRIYSKEICDKMMEDIKNLGYISLGSPRFTESGLIDEASVNSFAAKVEDVHYDGDRIMIDSIILDTPHGNMVNGFLKEHSQSSFTCTPAGFGSCHKDGDHIKVANDYQIISVHIIPKERQA